MSHGSFTDKTGDFCIFLRFFVHLNKSSNQKTNKKECSLKKEVLLGIFCVVKSQKDKKKDTIEIKIHWHGNAF